MKRILTILMVLLLLFACKKESLEEKEEVEETIAGKNRCMITLIQGEVTFKDGSGNLLDRGVGDLLEEQDLITTAADAQVELQIGERSNVRIKGGSELALASLLLEQELESTKVKLFKGNILAESEKLTEGSSFKVETDTFTVGIRGTQFGVVNDLVRGAKVLVKEGRVAVTRNWSESLLAELAEAEEEVVELIKAELAGEIVLAAGEKMELDKEQLRKEEEVLAEGIKRVIKAKGGNERQEELKKFKQSLKGEKKRPLNKEESEEYLDEDDFENMKAESDIFEKRLVKVKLKLKRRDRVPVMVTFDGKFYSFAYDELDFVLEEGQQLKVGLNSQIHLPQELTVGSDSYGEQESLELELELKIDPAAEQEEKPKTEKELKREFKELGEEIEEKVEELEEEIEKKSGGKKKDDKVKKEVKEKAEKKLDELEEELKKGDGEEDPESELENLMEDIKDETKF